MTVKGWHHPKTGTQEESALKAKSILQTEIKNNAAKVLMNTDYNNGNHINKNNHNNNNNNGHCILFFSYS